jgi:hypothetical protein
MFMKHPRSQFFKQPCVVCLGVRDASCHFCTLMKDATELRNLSLDIGAVASLPCTFA